MLEIIRCTIPIMAEDVVPFHISHQLYAALSRIEPEIHRMDDIAISPIENAMTCDTGLILKKGSYFQLQLQLESVGLAYRFPGKQVKLGSSKVRFGMLRPIPIRPSNHLVSRFVTVKNKTESNQMEDHIRTQLHALNTTYPGTEPDEEVNRVQIKILRRRVVLVHRHAIVGFGVRLEGLSERLSVLVQKHSVAGRRKFGSGFFVPG